MKVLVSGASGFIGQHLLPYLRARGDQVVVLQRATTDGDELHPYWDPDKNIINPAVFDGVDAVVHLSGEGVQERWTADKKARIYHSRVRSTQLLANAIASEALAVKPKVLISASAIGYYGDRGSQILPEDSGPGSGFLSKVCLDWEAALAPAAEAGVRTASLRFGIVLSTTGGALPRLLKPFRLGTAGRIGSGRQYISWVTIHDAVEAIAFALNNEDISGAVNVVAPSAETNAEFVKQLAERLHCRRTIPVPSAVVYFAFGSEMSNELLLSSARAIPEKLSAAGFQFKYPALPQALDHLLREGG